MFQNFSTVSTSKIDLSPLWPPLKEIGALLEVRRLTFARDTITGERSALQPFLERREQQSTMTTSAVAASWSCRDTRPSLAAPTLTSTPGGSPQARRTQLLAAHGALDVGFRLGRSVVLADEEYHAARIYQSVGFQERELLINLGWWEGM